MNHQIPQAAAILSSAVSELKGLAATVTEAWRTARQRRAAAEDKAERAAIAKAFNDRWGLTL